MSILVESALLGHGLRSISDTELLSKWPSKDLNIAWIEDKQIRIGSLEDFIKFRKNSQCSARADGLAVKEQQFQDNSFLTASGTMVAAERFGFDIVVSAGIGGVGDIVDEPFCYDLVALSLSNVVLIATGPKDMLDHQATFDWLKQNNVKIFGNKFPLYNGYIFKLDSFPLEFSLQNNKEILKDAQHRLILNPIDQSKRIQNITILNKGIQKGKEAESAGEYYHPAVNSYFDEVTKGLSSNIQFDSLIDNILLAKVVLQYL